MLNEIYVGNLPFKVAQDRLETYFGAIGPIKDIVFVNQKDDTAIGAHAFITYHNPGDVDRAVTELNYKVFEGRILAVLRGDLKTKQALRVGVHEGSTCLFIKPVRNMTIVQLHELFAKFGQIISSRIRIDKSVRSDKGCGYVQFLHPNHGAAAIAELDGSVLNGEVLSVGEYKATYTNVHVKNLPPSIKTQDDLTRLFATYGPIRSVFLALEADGSSKGFGFCDFATHEGAARAITALNGRKITEDGQDFVLAVSKAMNRKKGKGGRRY